MRIKDAPSSRDFQIPAAPYGTPQNPWRSPDGSVISCTEKLKVMQENLDELRQYAQEALEDAVLMGCDETQVKEAFLAAIAALSSGYAPADAQDNQVEKPA
ncbi:MAG: hypothetical protein LBU45_00595 [Azoarcus sp.]|jgi:hypothetical protein|nr:hypothetical protein [Azoarcus sp.]